MKNQFKVGVAREVISPKLGAHLQGYPRIRPTEAIRDDLNATAVAFEKGDLKGVMISADILDAPKQVVDVIRKGIQKETGVDFENIVFSATHTHSGPATKTTAGWGEANDEYVESILIPQTIKAGKLAYENLIPAVMGVATIDSKVAMNRRQYTEKGGVTLGQNPFGIYDSTMTILAFKTLEGEGIVNMVHYGCHGTSSSATLEVTRDWMGVMVDGVETQTGTITAFFNGAEGDVGPRLSNGMTWGTHGYREMEEVGNLATLDAVKAYKSIKEYRDVNFEIIKGQVSLPYKPIMTVEEVNARIVELGDPEKLVDSQIREMASLKTILQMHENGEEIKTELTFDQALFAFNSTIFVPFPFEMFSTISLRLRQFSPYQNTLCLSNANDTLCYLPAQEDLVRGGYEVSMFKGGIYKLKDDTDSTIIKENLRIMREKA